LFGLDGFHNLSLPTFSGAPDHCCFLSASHPDPGLGALPALALFLPSPPLWVLILIAGALLLGSLIFVRRRILACTVALRQAARREAELRDELEKARRARADLLNALSHELRTPLNGIFGLTELAIDSVNRPEQQTFLDVILTCAESLLRVISDVVDVSKAEAGKLELDQKPFSPVEEISALLPGWSAEAAAKGLEFRHEFADGIPRKVHGDPHRLRQILANLLSHAFKFTESGVVTLAVRAEPGQSDGKTTLTYVISDTGQGISKDLLPHLFNALEKVASPSGQHPYAGAGLGLTIGVNPANETGGEGT
jgi:two-component system, sensor histidine kinase and response regulator